MLIAPFLVLVGCASQGADPGTSFDANGDPVVSAEQSLNVGYESKEDGRLTGYYFDGGSLALTIDTQRGDAVDVAAIDEDIEVPDHLVYLRMTLPSGQVVYEAMQADLPLVAGGEVDEDPFGEGDGEFVGDIAAVDNDLLSAAASAFADAIDSEEFAPEQLVLDDAAARVLDDVPEEEAISDGSPPPPPSTCSGSTCEDKDPSTYGCDTSAVNAATYRISWFWGEYLYLRYSSGCGGTNWGKYTSSTGEVSTVYVERYSPSTTYSSYHNGTLNYTNMTYCPSSTSCLARAKVTLGSKTYATGYY